MNRIQIGMSVGSSVCPTDVGRYKNEGDDVNMKNLQELPKLKDSISYLYIEHAIIEQNDTAVVAIKKEGKIPIPIAAMTCLLLGPGTRVTHAAIRALCDNGCMAIWCGENATRFYAAGIGETRSAKNLLKQAGACMDQDKHLEVAKRMYQIRFSKMKTDGMTLQQLRGMEGIRVRKAYELAAKTTGIVWKKRSYKSTDWDAADPINQALSEANALLYGLCHAAIVSLGYSAGLGFIHTGKQLSFVYDVADLYKAETTIPVAFEAVRAAQQGRDLHKEIRMRCRTHFANAKVLSRIAQDVAWVLQTGESEEQNNGTQVGDLWDDEAGVTSGGQNYGERGEEP